VDREEAWLKNERRRLTSGRLTDLVPFVVFMGVAGGMAENTSRSYRTAVEALQKVIPDDHANVRIADLDVDGVIEAFIAREAVGDTYSTSTIDTYVKRFRTAVTEYRQFLDDPDGYDGPRWRAHRVAAVLRSDRRVGDLIGHDYMPDAVVGDVAIQVKHRLHGEGGREALRYPFPLENGGTAVVEVPRDVTQGDVVRLTSFLASLVVTDAPSDALSLFTRWFDHQWEAQGRSPGGGRRGVGVRTISHDEEPDEAE
jgi:hypothetical protein